MTRLVILSFFILLFWGLASLFPQTLTVGISPNPPLKYFDEKGIATGFFVELLKVIGKDEGWSFNYRAGSFTQCQEWLESGEIDIIPNIGYSVERAKRFVFNKESGFTTWAQVYVNDQSDIQSILDLDGKRIAVQRGDFFVQDPTYGFLHLMAEFDIQCELVEQANYLQVLELVSSGQVDAGIINRIIADINSPDYKVKKTAIIFSPVSLRFAFSKSNPQTPELADVLDAHLKKLKAVESSEYYALLSRFLLGERNLAIPRWVRWGIAISLVFLFFAFVSIYRLRRKVTSRSMDLQKEKKLVSTILETSPVGIVVVDSSKRIQFANQEFKQIVRLENDVYLGKEFRELKWKIFDPDNKKIDEDTLLFNKVLQGETSFSDLHINFEQGGEIRHISVNGSPLIYRDDTIGGVFTVLDISPLITSQKELEDSGKVLEKNLKEKVVLLQEMHHRVKNNLQIISSLLRMQSAYSDNPETQLQLREGYNRIIAMSHVHEMLYQSDNIAEINLKEYLVDLCNRLSTFIAGNHDRITTEVRAGNIFIGVDTAVPLCLMVNELVSNALEHAFPDDRNGNIKIEVDVERGEYLRLSVSDNGIGNNNEWFEHEGQTLGLQLVKSLSAQLQAEIATSFDGGTTFSFLMPLQIEAVGEKAIRL
jgi:PAS domain S-box-containing protein